MEVSTLSCAALCVCCYSEKAPYMPMDILLLPSESVRAGGTYTPNSFKHDSENEFLYGEQKEQYR